MSKTNPARGMRDFLPSEVRKREYVIGVIKQVYESYGFEPLETPAVENIDTLMGKYGDEGNQLIFKILKRGEKLRESQESGESSESDDSQDSRLADLALRYDLTVPLARVVANHKNDLPKFFKRYQIQPVWRADRPARGRFREFYQCDVDVIGSESMIVEAEIISAASDILTKLGFEDYTIRLNHRSILMGILGLRGVDQIQFASALVTIDKLDKIGEQGVLEELVSKGIENKVASEILTSFRIMRTIYATMITSDKLKSVGAWWMSEKPFLLGSLRHAREEFEKSDEACEGIDKLSKIVEPLESTKTGKHIKFDFSLARGLSYYTGTIIEINVDGIGSLGGGGRYDGLIGMFGKEHIPACGFSLGLERILVVMEERGMFPSEIADSAPADVMVTIWSEETIAGSLKLANELRAVGLRVTVYPETDKLGKQMKYADVIKVPFVCVLGESELADGTVTLKNMKTGEQQAYPRDEIASKIV